MRRVHVPELLPGDLPTDAAQTHHLRDVLRLGVGDAVEAFDAAGRTAVATVRAVVPGVVLRVDAIAPPPAVCPVVVAAAVPKGERADWMVEKLCELGVARFVPLRTARSVVHPEHGKLDRWRRIAVEAAKQSRRAGVLAIDPLTPVEEMPSIVAATTTPHAAGVAGVSPGNALPDGRRGRTTPAVYFSTRPAVRPFRPDADDAGDAARVLLIGPEGGWTVDEESAFDARGWAAAGLGPTVLRVETAAVLAAGLAVLAGDAS